MIGVDPCGRREQYQIIRNYGQQMRGTLPPEISMISTLWEITLSDHLLWGTIPEDFRKLTELDTLSLSFNLFSGTIPDFTWNYEDMVHMDLAYNFFKGTIPDGVSQTEPKLRVLFMENNDISGSIPNDFGQLDWKRLHLDGKDPLADAYNRGLALEKAGDFDGAPAAYTQALELDPADHGGVSVRLAAMGKGPVPDAAPDAYVATLFDQNAAAFDDMLVEQLGYAVPMLLRERFAALGLGQFERLLDLGCGTGLTGASLSDLIDHVTGVDLSEQMLDEAHERDCYDALYVAEAAGFLHETTEEEGT